MAGLKLKSVMTFKVFKAKEAFFLRIKTKCLTIPSHKENVSNTYTNISDTEAEKSQSTRLVCLKCSALHSKSQPLYSHLYILL